MEVMVGWPLTPWGEPPHALPHVTAGRWSEARRIPVGLEHGQGGGKGPSLWKAVEGCRAETRGWWAGSTPIVFQ